MGQFCTMDITEQCVVALTWTLKDTLGEVLDVLDDPVEFLVGGDDLLPRIQEHSPWVSLTQLQVRAHCRWDISTGRGDGFQQPSGQEML